MCRVHEQVQALEMNGNDAVCSEQVDPCSEQVDPCAVQVDPCAVQVDLSNAGPCFISLCKGL